MRDMAQIKESLKTAGSIDYLTKNIWGKANLILLRKAISEFAHELIIEPIEVDKNKDWIEYELLPIKNKAIKYQFKAKRFLLDHWYIDVGSLKKTVNDQEAPPDLISFIIEFKREIRISKEILPTYLEEVSSTLRALAYAINSKKGNIDTLIRADYQGIECGMSGHPTFIANNGRIGFTSEDYEKFAPETGHSFQLLWIAVHQENAEFSGIKGLTYKLLIDQELSKKDIAIFEKTVVELGEDKEEYYFMPIHPWQWHNKLVHIFAADIAYNKIILLGFGEDNYRPQQSVRTFFNVDNPHKFYVKTALSILNMGFIRGLSPYYMSSTPEINIWVDNLIKNDLYLQKKAFTVIKEVATVGYRNRYYEEALENDNSTAYTKMLASLWRETAFSKLEKGQHVMTMAALLHVDSNENALLPVLIKKSNLSTTIWIERYLDCYLSPILHCFYTHDLVFMPHGENLIMVMEQYAPVKMIMKDIAEEVAVLSKEKKIPGQTSRIGVNVPDEFKFTYIFTDIFDCFFRYLSQILAIHCNYSDASFWELVANCVTNYQKENVHLSAKHKKFDLFSDEFPRCCLNRLQMGNNKQMVNLSDPIGSLKYAGFLKNPISAFNPVLESDKDKIK